MSFNVFAKSKFSPIKQALLKSIFFFSLLRAKSLAHYCWLREFHCKFCGSFDNICTFDSWRALKWPVSFWGNFSIIYWNWWCVWILEIWEQLKTIFVTTKLAPSWRYFGEIAIWSVLSCSLKIGMKCWYLGMLSSSWGNHLKGFWFKLLVDNPTTGLDNKQQWSSFPDVSLP